MVRLTSFIIPIYFTKISHLNVLHKKSMIHWWFKLIKIVSIVKYHVSLKTYSLYLQFYLHV